MEIHYNSWNEENKKPFGPIKQGQKVRWRVSVDDNADYVAVLIAKEGGVSVEYPLNRISNDTFEAEIPINSYGLYYYCLKAKWGEKSRFLGHDHGGQGKMYDDINLALPYLLVCYEDDVHASSWFKDAIVYQIFPDRFFNGNPHGEINSPKKNSFIYATQDDDPCLIRDAQGNVIRWDFFGGNLEGIRQKIPYLKELGVNTIYLNPIFEAESSHRYDTTDFMKIDPVLGTEEDFVKLAADLHKNGMHLILDGVFNHVGVNSPYFNGDGRYGKDVGAAQTKNSPYYKWFNFTHYPDKYECWWGVTNLPEVNKNDPDYQRLIYGKDGVLEKWVKLGADGWRIDVADELPMEFLTNMRKRLSENHKDILIGEVWEDAAVKRVSDQWRTYINGDNVTGTMNYPYRNFVVDSLLASSLEEQVSSLEGLIQIAEDYPHEYLINCLNNLGTHDTKRIKTVLNEDEDLVALAFVLMFMIPGVPCVYYGDEAGLIGQKDPDNRRFFPWGKESKKLQEVVQAMIKVRKENSTLVDGSVGAVLETQDVLAIVRYDDEEVVTCWININGENSWKVGTEAFTFYNVPESVKDILDDELSNGHGPQLAPKSYKIVKYRR